MVRDIKVYIHDVDEEGTQSHVFLDQSKKSLTGRNVDDLNSFRRT